jgi:hypothetical protein
VPRPVEVNGWPAETVVEAVLGLIPRFPMLEESPALFSGWLRIVEENGIVGKQVHDAWLVALMRVHRVSRLMTYNAGDFRPYGIEIVAPGEAEPTRWDAQSTTGSIPSAAIIR